MIIDRNLSLIIPVYQGEKTLHIHATAIGASTFDTYFMPLAKTFSAIVSEGLGVVSGPRVAAKVLREVSKNLGVWDGDTGVEKGLLTEIRRLANVFAPTDHGWDMIPLEDAIRSNLIDSDDGDEIENALVFFTVSWHMVRKKEREATLSGAASLWGARLESLSCTEFRASLPTLTEPETTPPAQ